MSVKLATAIVMASILIFITGEGWGRDWKPYQATKEGDIYYFDLESLEKLPDNIIQVWVKTEKTEFDGGNLKRHVTEVTGGRKDKVISEIIQVLEINCSSKTFRIINLAVYDKDKNIKEYFNDPSEWNPISSKSVTNYLYREVCKSP